MLTLQVDWNRLAEIDELQDYFRSDFAGFKALIEQYIDRLERQFNAEQLEKLSYLRVLEVTNGCTQWGFRRQDPQSLSAEDARRCMKMVMGFIKNKRVYFPSRGTIVFNPQVEQFIENGRQLYCNAFKRNLPGMQREYYASSTAQFIVFGKENLISAMNCVQQNYENMFSAYYIEKGRNYIAPYLASISDC